MTETLNDIRVAHNGELQTKKDGPISREAILNFEEMLQKAEDTFDEASGMCPLVHSFSDGIYVRQITIPAGLVLTGKIHKHEHPNFLLKGEVVVVTEQGQERIVGPISMISKPGTKRALYSVTELVWTTIHHNPTNTQDLDELERIIIASSYEDYEKHLNQEQSMLTTVKKRIIKMLSK